MYLDYLKYVVIADPYGTPKLLDTPLSGSGELQPGMWHNVWVREIELSTCKQYTDMYLVSGFEECHIERIYDFDVDISLLRTRIRVWPSRSPGWFVQLASTGHYELAMWPSRQLLGIRSKHIRDVVKYGIQLQAERSYRRITRWTGVGTTGLSAASTKTIKSGRVDN